LVDAARVQGATAAPDIRTFSLSGVPRLADLKKKLVDSVEAAVTGRKDAQLALDEAAAFWNRQLK
jgi:putative chitobiose transport system substrate-binding protein